MRRLQQILRLCTVTAAVGLFLALASVIQIRTSLRVFQNTDDNAAAGGELGRQSVPLIPSEAAAATTTTMDSNNTAGAGIRDLDSDEGKPTQRQQQQQQKPEFSDKAGRPELFMDRLNRLLPPRCRSVPPGITVLTCVDDEYDDRHRLVVEDVARIEQELLQFDIPRTVVLDFQDAEYISLNFWRWKFTIDAVKPPERQQCPNCVIRHTTTNAAMTATPLALYRTR
jgi:hypothetical protein